MMKRTQTKWRWFAAAAVPSTLIASGLMVGVANGSVPVAINVAGDSFKVSADRLEGTDFKQYASIALQPGGDPATGDGADPVAASAIGHAELTNLCQSLTVQTPWGQTVSMLIRAGDQGTPAEAENLLIGLQTLEGDAEFTNITIGTDGKVLADSVDPDGALNAGVAGTIGQQADSILITELEQTALSTTAGTFTLNDLHLEVNLDGEECFVS